MLYMCPNLSLIYAPLNNNILLCFVFLLSLLPFSISLVYKHDHMLVLFELRMSVSSYFCNSDCFSTSLTSMYQCDKNSQYILTDNLYPSIKSSHNHSITSHNLHSIAPAYLDIIKIHTMTKSIYLHKQ